MSEKILCVDDEPNILEAYKRQLRRFFNIVTATGPQEGLKALKRDGPFAVVVSDMRMPEMDGSQFLSIVRERSPDSVRMLLTGQADMKDAIAVVNAGQIFRFLTKPCPPDILGKALTEGLRQHKLITAERELLDKTLKGSIKLLVDILAMMIPEAFSRSNRLRSIAKKIAQRIQVDPTKLWEIDFAILLSQIGCVTIPQEILQKKYQGEKLTNEEFELYLRHPQTGGGLLANIPRLKGVAEAIRFQEKRFNGEGPPEDDVKGIEIPVTARILKVLHDYDELVALGKSRKESHGELTLRQNWYDPKVLAALDAELSNAGQEYVVKMINPEEIETGAVIVEDIKSEGGAVLVHKGNKVTEVIKMRILNYAQGGRLAGPIKILDYIN